MPSRILSALCLTALVALVALGIHRAETRYLASDQFGYLEQARAFAEGRLTPAWPPWEVLGSRLAPGDRVEIFHHSMIATPQGLKTRYSPGFPILLALGLIAGPGGPFFVVPVFFACLLAVFWGIAVRLQSPHPDSPWIAVAGLNLLLLVPTQLHLWALSPLRDIPAHAFALGGLLLLLFADPPRRAPGAGRRGLAGFLLGFAASIRPDASLYFLSAGALLAASRSRPRGVSPAVAGALFGLLPLLVYDTLVWGGPLRSPQMDETGTIETGRGHGSENERATGARAGEGAAGIANPSDARPPSPPRAPGSRRGAIRPENLGWTLPRIGRYALGSFGPVLLGVAAIGAVASAAVAPRALLLALPYGLPALFVYGMWGHVNPRYFTGIVLGIGILVALGLRGLMDLGARACRSLTPAGRCCVALCAASLGAIVLSRRRSLGASGVEEIEALVVAAIALAPLIASRPLGLSPPRLLAAALLVVAAARSWASEPPRRFGPREVEVAREALSRIAVGRAFVFVSEPFDLAAENIEHYTGASALPLSDLASLGWGLPEAAGRLVEAGYSVYRIAPGSDREGGTGPPLEASPDGVVETVLDTRTGEDLAAWFVGPSPEGGISARLARLDPPPLRP